MRKLPTAAEKRGGSVSEISLGPADAADAAELHEIYAWYVENTAISFEVTPPGVEGFARRLREVRVRFPYLKAVADGQIVGYAYAHEQMARAAYQWNAELSVYLKPDSTGRGLGTVLYTALMAILKQQKIRNVYGGVTLPNPASERLHLGLGFARLGTYHQTGYKLGAWHDVAWFEKNIGEHELPPAPPIPVSQIDIEAVLRSGDFARRPSKG